MVYTFEIRCGYCYVRSEGIEVSFKLEVDSSSFELIDGFLYDSEGCAYMTGTEDKNLSWNVSAIPESNHVRDNSAIKEVIESMIIEYVNHIRWNPWMGQVADIWYATIGQAGFCEVDYFKDGLVMVMDEMGFYPDLPTAKRLVRLYKHMEEILEIASRKGVRYMMFNINLKNVRFVKIVMDIRLLANKLHEEQGECYGNHEYPPLKLAEAANYGSAEIGNVWYEHVVDVNGESRWKAL